MFFFLKYAVPWFPKRPFFNAINIKQAKNRPYSINKVLTFYTVKNKGSLLALMAPQRTFNFSFDKMFFIVEKVSLDYSNVLHTMRKNSFLEKLLTKKLIG